MKRIIMLTMVLLMMLISLGGCFWGFEGRERDGGYNRGEGHDNRGGGHDDRGEHDRGEEHGERH